MDAAFALTGNNNVINPLVVAEHQRLLSAPCTLLTTARFALYRRVASICTCLQRGSFCRSALQCADDAHAGKAGVPKVRERHDAPAVADGRAAHRWAQTQPGVLIGLIFYIYCVSHQSHFILRLSHLVCYACPTSVPRKRASGAVNCCALPCYASHAAHHLLGLAKCCRCGQLQRDAPYCRESTVQRSSRAVKHRPCAPPP